MITIDFQPFSIIEDMGFQAYSKALNPSYTQPSRKFFFTDIIASKILGNSYKIQKFDLNLGVVDYGQFPIFILI
jgi:hypothetical protein